MDNRFISQMKRIMLPLLVFIAGGILAIGFLALDIFSMKVNTIITVVIIAIDYAIFLFWLVLRLQGMYLRYFFLGKRFKDNIAKSIPLSKQKLHYRRTGIPMLLDKSCGWARDNERVYLLDERCRNFKYSGATYEEKREFVLYKFLFASKESSCQAFYDDVQSFNYSEALELLSTFNLGPDYQYFLDNVLRDKKISESIFRFETSAYNELVKYANIESLIDWSINDDLFYDLTKHFRVVIKEDDGKYKWSLQRFDQGVWISTSEKAFDNHEDAKNEAEILIDEYNSRVDTIKLFEIKEKI